MHPAIGDTVKLRDGRILTVTDAVDQSAPEVIENYDDIIRGYAVGPDFSQDQPKFITTTSQEVVSILD